MASTMSGDRSKRNRNVLSIQKKLEIIERLDKGESVDGIAKSFEIGKRTVYDMKTRREEILTFALKLESEECFKKRKTMRTAQDEKLDEAVYIWCIQRISKGDPISGPLLCEKALQMNEKLGGSTDFKASTGWLRNFKTRHGIGELQVQGQRLSRNPTASEEFKSNFHVVLGEDYSPHDVYHANKMGLNWRSLPRKSLNASKGETPAPGFKVSKERVTIMACANASGTHPLPLLMIGKSQKPRCFKNVKCLPVCYKTQANGWMNAELFYDWYANDFIPDVKRFREKELKVGKVVLLLDNSPSHSDIERLNSIDYNFEVKYLPSNVTALIHPMDQGVTEKLKRMYKKEVLRCLLLAEGEECVITFSKQLSLKDCSYMLAEAWHILAIRDNLRNAWNKLEGDNVEGERDPEDDLNKIVDLFSQIPGFSGFNRGDVQAWIEGDGDPGFPNLNDDEIVRMVQEENEEEEETEKVDDVDESGPTHGEAFTALETVLSWYEKQDESCSTQLLTLKRMRDLAAKKRCSNMDQKNL